jgi:hypothetical protein
MSTGNLRNLGYPSEFYRAEMVVDVEGCNVGYWSVSEK